MNLVEHPCKTCGLIQVLNGDGVCMYCDPAEQVRMKAKELEVKSWLDAKGIKYESHDRMIDRGACIRNRPDFIFDAGTHMVVLEVDEHQHQQYACECEQTRMVNISQSLGMPTLFVRYNPDPYRSAHGKRCDPAKGTRQKELLERLQYGLQNPPQDGFCEVIYLYYDGYQGALEPRRVVTDLHRETEIQ
jgi:hypothetical protein